MRRCGGTRDETMTEPPYPVLVIGAGPAGVATAASLARCGIAYRLLERGDSLAHSWAQLYDSLVLHTGRHMSALPGMRYPPGTPLFPARADFVRYLHAYAERFGVRAECGSEVRALKRSSHGWNATLGDGRVVEGSAAVVCSGIIANPRVPELPGRDAYRGRLLHSVEYRRPAGFEGQCVLVVGVGNSGGEIGSELARAGARVTLLVRSGAHVVPLTIAGIPIQYLSHALRRLPRPVQEWATRQVQRATDRRRGPPVIPRPAHSPLDAIPLIGFHLADAIQAGQVAVRLGTIDHLTSEGAVFSDGAHAPFDAIILATGFAPALGMLGDLIRRDACGFALRRDGVASADQPGLYFVGHNYDTTGGIANIRRDAVVVAERIVWCRRREGEMQRERARRVGRGSRH